ncbi:hypothetical protein HK100_006393 [Physocladia obscura]|uniref:DUF885 domain-containing protein n=1 Tax=Physocladia obscura TaxID=109957 RepID=A0AAD5T628_9FUNG|nr:hypothetical protein HK100_006393 [Physocladia obscura]
MPATKTTTTTTTTIKTVDANGVTTKKTTTKTVTTAPVTVKTLLDRLVDLKFEEDPFNCAVFGVKRHEDKIFDLSKEALLANREKLIKLKADVDTFSEKAGSALSASEAADVAFLKESLGSSIEFIGIPGEEGYLFELMHSHMSSPFTSLELIFAQYQAKETKQDFENFRTRLQLLGPQFDNMIASFRSGIARKITLNKNGIDLLIQQFSASAGFDAPDLTEFARKSPLNVSAAAKAKEVTGDEDFLVPAIRDYIIPGYAKVATFLKDEYLQHARVNPGLYGLPNYEKEYAKYILNNTNVAYTADQVHEIGLAEVARIEALMESAKTACGYEGTLSQFRKDINDKEKFPQLFYEDPNDAIPEYAAICAAAKVKMVDYFDRFPKFDCNVLPVPEYLEKQQPLAFYIPGTPTKGGVFMANMYLHKIKPSHQKTALVLHEANPGHHHQVSLAFEDESMHLARRMDFQTSYAEGWGLYCEYLGEEMGFYTDPFQYFGRLELEIWRAIRLVVDSGLHAKGWSEAYAIDYMLSKMSVSRAEVETEVRRYCVIPGQALAYKIGEMKIKELRAYATERLGELFDLKKFHAVVIDGGSMPLGALDAVVRKWVQSLEVKKQ